MGSDFLHCFALWTLIWVYFESVVVLPSQFQVGLPVAFLIVVIATILPRRAGRRALARASRRFTFRT